MTRIRGLLATSLVGALLATTFSGSATASPASGSDRDHLMADLGVVSQLIDAAAVLPSARSVQRDAAPTLPGAASRKAVAVKPGVVLHPDLQPGIDGAVITTATSESTLVVLQDDKAPTAVVFPLNLRHGATAVVDSLGGVLILNESGRMTGRINAPYAIDASGQSLPTSYKLENGELTQFISTAGASFPIVADPHYTWGIVTGTVYFNKNETLKIALGSGFLTALAPFAPPPFNFIFTASAAAATAYAGYAVGTNQCIKIKSTGSIGYYSGTQGDGYCR